MGVTIEVAGCEQSRADDEDDRVRRPVLAWSGGARVGRGELEEEGSRRNIGEQERPASENVGRGQGRRLPGMEEGGWR